MLFAEATVEIAHPSRYLVQLCRHFSHRAQSRPEIQAHIEWSHERGVVSFGWGRCALRVAPGVLTLWAEAPDEESLQLVEHLVADHLERFARRDHLTATWTPPQGGAEKPTRKPPDGTDKHTPELPSLPDAATTSMPS